MANPFTDFTDSISPFKEFFLSSVIPGPIIAKSGFSFAIFKNLFKVSGKSSTSGLSIKAYLVFTFFNPILFPFP